jgi:hypothetical protein
MVLANWERGIRAVCRLFDELAATRRLAPRAATA